MLKFVRYVVVGLLFSALFAPVSEAQRHPMPGSKSEPPVLCTGCPSTNAAGQNNDGLPTYPYSGVLVDHVGRYVDSSNTGSFQNLGYRTARARFIRPAFDRRGTAPPRMYIQIGNGIAAYNMDTFFSTKLPGGMVPISNFVSGIMGFPRNPPESVLRWDGLIYPEGPTSNWQPTGQDIQDPMGKGSPIDFDDRGYVYSAHTIHGWGIVSDAGKTDGSQLTKMMQWIAGPKAGYANVKADTSGVSPESVIAMKLSASQYRAIVADRSGTWAVYDVSGDTPSAWRMLSKSPEFAPRYGIRKAERDEANKRVAYVDGGFNLRIYDYSAIVEGGAPVEEYLGTTGFAEIAFDESSNLWAVEKNGTVWKLAKSGNGYTKTTYSPFTSRFEPILMHVGAGYLAIGGIDYTASTYDVRLFRTESSGLKALDIDGFFMKYYHQAPANYATPPAYTSIAGQSADLKIVKWAGDTYLMYSGFGIGDVFKLEAGNAISITAKNTFGSPNPNSKNAQAGPIYGDVITFVGNSSSNNVNYDLLWDFGDSTTGRSRTGEDKTHQYTGLTTAAQITAPKVVRAQTVQDPGIQAQHNLSLKLPTPRVGIAGVTAPITASTTGITIVAGGSFTDASDGVIEGHYSVWTRDTEAAVKQRPNETFGAGAVGPHTLTFQGHYGAYDASLNLPNPYATPALTIGYTVVPFTVTMGTPTTAGAGSATFTATADVSTDLSVFANGQKPPNWTVTWKKNGVTPAATVGTNAAQTVLFGTIPPQPFTVQDGDVVTVEASVIAAELAGPAQQYVTATASTTISVPDPFIDVEGCLNAGSPCKLTAKSLGQKSQAGWTYTWVLTLPTGGTQTSSAAIFQPTLTAAGTYAVNLTASKDGFSSPAAAKSLTVAASLCGSLPPAINVSINASCTSNCPPGTAIEFTPSFMGYARQACDVYQWNFGDGTSASTEVASKTYANPGTYNVSLTITNSAPSQVIKSRSISVSSGNTEPPPATCTAPPSAAILVSGCSGGSTCRTTDTITFTARRGSSGLQTCDNVAWTFPDGASSARTVTKNFNAPGTYPVKLVVSNSFGTAEVTQNIVINPPASSNCSTAPQPGNFVIEYTGATSGCTQANGANCTPGETLAFSSPNYYYQVGSCDNFLWSFGDGGTSTERNPTHTFTGGQTYNVTLKVSNGSGQWTYTRSVPFVASVPTKPVPTITFTASPATGYKGKTVTFTATSNLATTTGWTWNFGDGPADTSQAGQTKQSSTITHTFNTSKTYTVKVTGWNAEETIAAKPVGTAQANIVITDAPAIPEYKFLLPVTAYTAGQGGSAWRTDVQIYNPDPQVSETKPLVMDALFKGVTYPLNMIKSTHVYEDFLGTLLAHQKEDQGPVIITTKSAMTPPQIWTRTYTQTDHGTFGQYIPAIRIDNVGGGAAAGDTNYYMSGLRHDARYRTNVGFLNPNAAPITATVTVYDASKFKLGEFPLTLTPFQLDQFPLKSKLPTLPDDEPFSIKVVVPAGNWLIGYASYIDGLSNDPVYIQALPESDVASPDYKTTVLPGVGHTGQWRSDVTIFNPDPDGVLFDMQYYNSAGEKKGEALSVPLDPGKFLEYGDILKQGVLGNVEDGLGTLKVIVKDNHEKYPMVFARTYFDNGANGTYGQGIAGFSAARANVKAGKHAIIAGVRNTSTYKTNIGLVNLADTAVTATVTLLDPTTGAAVSSIPYTIQPNQSIVGAYNGWGAITQGTFKIEATGNVWAFASIVDLQTFDPEYVSATPIP